MGTDTDRAEKARSLYKKKDYKSSLAEWRKLERSHPSLPDTVRAEIFSAAYQGAYRALYRFHNYFDAIHNYEYALSHINSASPPADTLRKLYRGLSEALRMARRPQEAIAWNSKALELCENDDVYRAKLLRNKGRLFILTGKGREGAELFWKAKKIFEERHDRYGILDTVSMLADLLLFLDRKEEASTLLERYTSEKKDIPVWTYGLLGIIASLDSMNSKALEYFTLFDKMASRMDRDLDFRVHYHHARALILTGQDKSLSIQKAHAALLSLENQRNCNRDLMFQGAFLAETLPYYRGLFRLLMELDPARAYPILVLMKSWFSLLECKYPGFPLRAGPVEGFDPFKLKKFLSQQSVRRSFLDYAYVHGHIGIPSVKEICFSLHKNECILDYYLEGEKLYIFIIRANNFFFEIRKVPSNLPDDLKKWTDLKKRESSKTLSPSPSPAGLKTLSIFASKMGELLLPDKVPNRVFLVPCGKLLSAGLQNLGINGESGTLASDRETIFLSNSLLKRRRMPRTDIRVVVLHDSSLEYGKKESAFLKKEFKAGTLKKITDLRAKERLIFHAACHFTPSSDPWNIRIGVPGGLEISGKDLEGLDLSRTRAVLNVCEGGLSKRVTTEEYMDLARIFLARGAQEVLVSTRPLPDITAFMFIKEFYGVLATNPGCRFAEALKLAVRKFDGFSTLCPYIVRQ